MGHGTAGARRRTRRGAARRALPALAAVALLAGCGLGLGGHHTKDPTPKPRITPRRDAFVGFYSPEAGSLVGTGTILSVRFNRTITDRAAVERHITVTARPAAAVTGHWFGARRLDLRPARYWRPGSRVTLHLRLRGVRGAPNTYGSQAKDVTFTIGRDQRSTADAATHTLTVLRDGRLLRTLPMTAGSPQHTTYNGIMVIAEKYLRTRMNSRTVGFGGEYDIPDVPHAMRLTDSGTFVHGNYWSPADVFGAENVSHGCIGLLDTRGPARTPAGDDGRDGSDGGGTPAGWFFARSLIGDVITVVHSDDRTVSPDNGMSGWNLDWTAWRSGSALR
ncbi:Lipoprotein-anchoring transpeptidase ErfK/SrfK [Streptomyces sp. DvalAA-14]|uniref:L,D-transpeptidase n=1 Tax=unclassified Streptomyces TaxID=2593676 RepID=UPI00081AFE5F|nr:Ig-like domain-containing protein [Streptomyces sp. DvalAA-14]SCD52585.1 Lipoprotein-anchoring transpeptidase ErfK/SrfK [Streptomyces sp. DvalAA-14]